MAAIYSNGSNRWNILGFNFNKRDALSSVYKISTSQRWRKLNSYWTECAKILYFDFDLKTNVLIL